SLRRIQLIVNLLPLHNCAPIRAPEMRFSNTSPIQGAPASPGAPLSPGAPASLPAFPVSRPSKKTPSITIAILAFLVFSLCGCQTPQFGGIEQDATSQPESIVLHEGDVVRITFPGAPNLNTVQTIRRDGRIALQLIGEFQAAGMTPS